MATRCCLHGDTDADKKLGRSRMEWYRRSEWLRCILSERLKVRLDSLNNGFFVAGNSDLVSCCSFFKSDKEFVNSFEYFYSKKMGVCLNQNIFNFRDFDYSFDFCYFANYFIKKVVHS